MAAANPIVVPGSGGGGLDTREVLAFADLRLDTLGQSLSTASGEDIPLTRGEFRLLQAFVQNAGRVLSRDQLLDCVSGRRSDPFDRSIDVLVGRLRRKIERDPRTPQLIVTSPGFGYKFTAKPLTLTENTRPTIVPEAAPSPSDTPLTGLTEKPGAVTAEAKPRPASRRSILAAGVSTAVAVAAGVALFLGLRHPTPLVPAQPAIGMQIGRLPLPDKPSVAVLPFISISGDTRQERLADGITEDVITDLSRFRQLFVIASNTMLTYKGRAVNVAAVGRELGVRYVLEGSIQTDGGRARVTAQLVEAATNAHLWSERYDRPLNDIFDVQNDVTQKIAAALGGLTSTLAAAEAASVRRKPPTRLDAYDYYVMAQELHYHVRKEDTLKAEGLFKKAIELDPQFARAYAGLGDLYDSVLWLGSAPAEPTALIEKGKDLALKAIALDPADAYPHQVLGQLYIDLSDPDRAFAEFEQALVLNPNDPDVLIRYGGNMYIIGRSQDGVEMMDCALRLNPRYPPLYDYFVDPLYAVGRYDRVIATVRRTISDQLPWNYMLVAMSFAQLGKQADTAAAVDELRRRYPDFSLERAFSDFGTIKDQPTLERYLDGVRKAGLNECATEAELRKYPKMIHLAVCDSRRVGQ